MFIEANVALSHYASDLSQPGLAGQQVIEQIVQPMACKDTSQWHNTANSVFVSLAGQHPGLAGTQ